MATQIDGMPLRDPTCLEALQVDAPAYIGAEHENGRTGEIARAQAAIHAEISKITTRRVDTCVEAMVRVQIVAASTPVRVDMIEQTIREDSKRRGEHIRVWFVGAIRGRMQCKPTRTMELLLAQ